MTRPLRWIGKNLPIDFKYNYLPINDPENWIDIGETIAEFDLFGESMCRLTTSAFIKDYGSLSLAIGVYSLINGVWVYTSSAYSTIEYTWWINICFPIPNNANRIRLILGQINQPTPQILEPFGEDYMMKISGSIVGMMA